MPTLSSDIFEVKNITVSDEYITNLANKYIELRSKFIVDEDHPIFKNLGFSTDALKEIIRQSSKPIRVGDDKRKAYNDIYRSDLGELLLTIYFEEEQATENFILPLKNLWDRELVDLPGRGFDGIGYRTSLGKIELLLGEAKVSNEDSTPQVVDSKEDSIFKTHLKNRTDKAYLERRIANYAKKLTGDHAAVMHYVLFCLSTDNNTAFEVVYGCCLVRDSSCLNDPKDFGKLKTETDSFRPGKVQFAIYSYDKNIEYVIDLFHSKIDAL